MRDPSGHTSLPRFVALAQVLREISATSGSYNGVTGANTRASKRTFGDTFTRNDGTETRAATWRMRDPSGHTSLRRFVALAHRLREKSATLGSYYGVTWPIHRPISVHSATFYRKRWH
ncbi:hypothetical protein DPMN_022641 [Dreissena polymorpha]|uniref:Uncharacterized protein n=1 Tax=Dreissena polymorpha TaxID=45954 RepID=A0A9D4SAY4_DREPO|nr:hypothetical protein DPMN_022641 [Dreissena polymorpha]